MKKLPKFQPENIRLTPGGLTRPGAYYAFDLLGCRIGMHSAAWAEPVYPQPEKIDHRHVVVIVVVCTEDAYIGHRLVYDSLSITWLSITKMHSQPV